MSTKSGHDQHEPAADNKHHHGGKHHGDHGDHGHHKHPPLRDAVMKAGAKGRHGAGEGGGTAAASDHAPSHGSRPRAASRRISVAKREHDRQSRHSEVHMTPMIEFENTYKLVPDTRFQEGQVKQIIATALKENLTDTQYDPRTMSRHCLEISEIIKERVKQLDMKRFKIVCMVMIGQNSDQSMMVTSRCLWNFNFDNFTSFTLKKEPYYAVGMVFATYAE